MLEDLPVQIRNTLRAALDPEEDVLWTGRPRWKPVVFPILGHIFLCGWGAGMAAMTISSAIPDILTMADVAGLARIGRLLGDVAVLMLGGFGVAVLLLGGVMLLRAVPEFRQLAYAVTNRRALILGPRRALSLEPEG